MPDVAPSIVGQPLAATALAPAAATFTVMVSGSPAPAYQWQVSAPGSASFTNITGATLATYTTPPTLDSDNGKRFRVVATNSAGAATSAPASLTVTPAAVAPLIGSQPVAAIVTAPSPAAFNVAATGTPAPSFQWQRSNDGGASYVAIAGATAANYSLATTTLADNGARFRVVVSNAAGIVTSGFGQLTVNPPGTIPVINTQPKAVTVIVQSTATFMVSATGLPAPTYQWQSSPNGSSSFADIPGAKAASYTTPATQTADNGSRFRVVVTNSTGSAISTEVTLTVDPASAMQGRAWTTGQLLETNDNNVVSQSVGIDDAGNAVVVFVKSDGNRNVLYATRGVPGDAGTAPAWSPPVAIDTAAAPAAATTGSSVATRVLTVAPNGNAVATWVVAAPCTATTYSTDPAAKCNYLYSASYAVASNRWSAPNLLTDTPSGSPDLRQFIDNNGDYALLYPGWERSGTNGFTNRLTALWRAAGQSTLHKQFFTDALTGYGFSMDGNGNMLFAGGVTQNSTTDIIAYRGSVGGGFGPQEILDQRSAAATYQNMAMGLNGQGTGHVDAEQWHDEHALHGCPFGSNRELDGRGSRALQQQRGIQQHRDGDLQFRRWLLLRADERSVQPLLPRPYLERLVRTQTVSAHIPGLRSFLVRLQPPRRDADPPRCELDYLRIVVEYGDSLQRSAGDIGVRHEWRRSRDLRRPAVDQRHRGADDSRRLRHVADSCPARRRRPQRGAEPVGTVLQIVRSAGQRAAGSTADQLDTVEAGRRLQPQCRERRLDGR